MTMPDYSFEGLGFAAGDVVVITGAGSGIGEATAKLAARSGLKVSAWDINEDGVNRVVGEIASAGGSASVVIADVGNSAEVAAGFSAAAALGPVRYLVNNAGPPNGFEGTFMEGLTASIGSVDLVTEKWRATVGGDASSCVSLSSVAGTHIATPTSNFYPTAKAAIAGYTRQLAYKLGGKPRFNAVGPGIIATPRMVPYLNHEGMKRFIDPIPMGRLGEAHEIAAAILFLLSPAASYVNGALLIVDGGLITA